MNAERRAKLDAILKRGKGQPPAAPEPPKKPLAEACAEQLDGLQKSFRERMAREEKRRVLATDSEYWVCLCFQSREEKESFLAKTGIIYGGDKYVDGRFAAKKLGIVL